MLDSNQNFVLELKDDYVELIDSFFNLKNGVNELNTKVFKEKADLTQSEIERFTDLLDYIENDVKCMRKTIYRNNN